MLYRDVLGSYTTYGGGSSGRIANIQLACGSCNDVILNPGDIFSYNDTVGERTIERGFQSAPVMQPVSMQVLRLWSDIPIQSLLPIFPVVWMLPCPGEFWTTNSKTTQNIRLKYRILMQMEQFLCRSLVPEKDKKREDISPPAVLPLWLPDAVWHRLRPHNAFWLYLHPCGPERPLQGKYRRFPDKEPYRRCCAAYEG